MFESILETQNSVNESFISRRQLIPQFPSQAISNLPSELAATATVLPLNCDDFDHGALAEQPTLALLFLEQQPF